jgi:hypothetical protein
VEVARAEVNLQRSRANAAKEEASHSSWAKATKAMEDAVSRTKAGCEQQLHSCELRSRELQEQLHARLQRSEDRCRELETELARMRSLATVEAKSATAEVEELKQLLSKQQADFQSRLAGQQTRLESLLDKQRHDLDLTKFDDDQQLRASGAQNKELRAQLAQQQAVAAADAAHASAQIKELNALLADQRKATQDALAKVAKERDRRHGVRSDLENHERLMQEQATVSKVVENVAVWISRLEAHVAEQEKSMRDILSTTIAQRDPAEGSRISASMTAEFTGVPMEVSMLSEISGTGDNEVDQQLQTLFSLSCLQRPFVRLLLRSICRSLGIFQQRNLVVFSLQCCVC